MARGKFHEGNVSASGIGGFFFQASRADGGRYETVAQALTALRSDVRGGQGRGKPTSVEGEQALLEPGEAASSMDDAAPMPPTCKTMKGLE